MKIFDNQVFFLGHNDIFSNMYPVDIYVDGMHLKSVEHLYVLCKAISAHDNKNSIKILNEDNPYEVKKMGYGILGLDPQFWDFIKDQIMICAMMAKFQQPHLKEVILASGTRELVEGSPNKVWGCGVHVKEIHEPIPNYPGKNLCGLCLMETREMLKQGITIDPNTILELL